MTLEESKLEILKKVESGTLTIEEGAHLLEILEGGESAESESQPKPQPEVIQSNVVEDTQMEETRTTAVPAGWKSLWGIPLFLGIVFMGLSGLWLYTSYGRSGMGVGFWFALFFLCVSIAIVFFGWRLIAGRWLALNITETKDGRINRVRIWVPFPLHLADWVMRTFGQYMPEKVQKRDFLRIFKEMDQSVPDGEPFQVDIDADDLQGNKNIEINLS